MPSDMQIKISRWGARFSAPVQTGPGAHSASCTMGTGSFPGVKSGWGVTLTPHPLWAVRPVQKLSASLQGCTLPFFLPFKELIKYLSEVKQAMYENIMKVRLTLLLIYLLTAVGLTPGGSSTVHIWTQTIHGTTQLTTLIGGFSGIRTQIGQTKINDELTE
jgi:hypothetical protein